MGHDVAFEGWDTQPASEPPLRSAFLFSLLLLLLHLSFSPLALLLQLLIQSPLHGALQRAGSQPNLHWWFIDLIKQGL